MAQKKILILFGHTDPDTFIGALATSYEKGAVEAGHSVKRVNIGELKFDPILHHGYKTIQALEPDLIDLQAKFKEADHLVVFYPNWWGTMPAILKGLFDRFFLPGFAFRFKKGSVFWDKLLKGKSATVVISMNTQPLLARLFFGDNSNEIKDNILQFAGFSPVRVRKFGPVEKCTPEERAGFLKQTLEWGRKGI